MPDIVTLNRLADLLGVDLNYFSGNPAGISGIDSAEQAGRGTAHAMPAGKQESNERPAWDLSRGNWVDADFSGLTGLHEKFSASNMQRCRFIGSELSGLLLKHNNVDSCNFSGSDISNSRIEGSNLPANNFTGCLLKGTTFSESNLDRCDFTNATLSGTQFLKSFLYGCHLTGTDFTGAVLKASGLSGIKTNSEQQNTLQHTVWKRTSFIDTQLADLEFTGTLDECVVENCKFTRVSFREVTFRNTFFKNNRNLKRVRFTACRADRMSYEFLKQGKADLSGIVLLAPGEEEA